jgi:hypothetical protein
MAPYRDIDPIIEACVTAHGSTLFTKWADEPVRFFYLPGLRPFECFQISIDQPRSGRITVFARSIDTDDGSEFEETWEVSVDALQSALAGATQAVDRWRNRAMASEG